MRNSRRCIVTGGCGFIGSALVRHLCREGREVLVVDKLTYAGNVESLKEAEGKYTLLVKDICDQEAMDAAFAEFRPDTIFHLAAESHVDRSIDGPGEFVRTNVVGTATYSASKASSDHLVRAWHDTYGMPVLITNCSNNYGPYHFPEKLIPLVILNCLDGKPLPVYGKGANVRDWLYVDDHVKALCLVNAKGVAGETYNVGGHNERTNLEVVKTVCAILDELRPRGGTDGDSGVPEPRPRYEDLITYVADRPGHDLRYAIDPSKLMGELGWRPEENFETGIRKTVQWYLDNEWWWRPIHEKKYAGQRLGRG